MQENLKCVSLWKKFMLSHIFPRGSFSLFKLLMSLSMESSLLWIFSYQQLVSCYFGLTKRNKVRVAFWSFKKCLFFKYINIYVHIFGKFTVHIKIATLLLMVFRSFLCCGFSLPCGQLVLITCLKQNAFLSGNLRLQIPNQETKIPKYFHATD